MNEIIFSHKKHTIWSGCEGCHPEIFVGIKKGTTKYSMDGDLRGEVLRAVPPHRGVPDDRLPEMPHEAGRVTRRPVPAAAAAPAAARPLPARASEPDVPRPAAAGGVLRQPADRPRFEGGRRQGRRVLCTGCTARRTPAASATSSCSSTSRPAPRRSPRLPIARGMFCGACHNGRGALRPRAEARGLRALPQRRPAPGRGEVRGTLAAAERALREPGRAGAKRSRRGGSGRLHKLTIEPAGEIGFSETHPARGRVVHGLRRQRSRTGSTRNGSTATTATPTSSTSRKSSPKG